MAGTREGGLKAAATNKKLYGDGKDGNGFYQRIGRLGGSISRGGSFSNREFATAMGHRGAAARIKNLAAKSS